MTKLADLIIILVSLLYPIDMGDIDDRGQKTYQAKRFFIPIVRSKDK